MSDILMSIAIGILIGMLAVLPAAVLILAGSGRSDPRAAEARYWSQQIRKQPPTVVDSVAYVVTTSGSAGVDSKQLEARGDDIGARPFDPEDRFDVLEL